MSTRIRAIIEREEPWGPTKVMVAYEIEGTAQLAIGKLVQIEITNVTRFDPFTDETHWVPWDRWPFNEAEEFRITETLREVADRRLSLAP